ncbi:MAG: NAD(P)H-dependent oxidoreductase subunit E [Ruminococcaceae bacterium]|nr:NAD(P)H-dependent oxidoreductase subunit E [Oscillospiraceae bacterium]
MKKQLTQVEFRGTKEQEAKLLEIIDAHKNERGAMMPILQQAQEVYGYLPVEVMQIIAKHTGKPVEEIFGIATFYSQFALNPKGEVAVAVCLGTACYVKGSGDIYEKFGEELGLVGGGTTPDGKWSLEATRCIGACGLAPVLTVNGNVYGRLTTKDVPNIIAEYK